MGFSKPFFRFTKTADFFTKILGFKGKGSWMTSDCSMKKTKAQRSPPRAPTFAVLRKWGATCCTTTTIAELTSPRTPHPLSAPNRKSLVISNHGAVDPESQEFPTHRCYMGSQHPSPNVKTFCNFESQIWRESFLTIFGQVLAGKYHITWWMLAADERRHNGNFKSRDLSFEPLANRNRIAAPTSSNRQWFAIGDSNRKLQSQQIARCGGALSSSLSPTAEQEKQMKMFRYIQQEKRCIFSLIHKASNWRQQQEEPSPALAHVSKGVHLMPSVPPIRSAPPFFAPAIASGWLSRDHSGPSWS